MSNINYNTAAVVKKIGNEVLNGNKYMHGLFSASEMNDLDYVSNYLLDMKSDLIGEEVSKIKNHQYIFGSEDIENDWEISSNWELNDFHESASARRGRHARKALAYDLAWDWASDLSGFIGFVSDSKTGLYNCEKVSKEEIKSINENIDDLSSYDGDQLTAGVYQLSPWFSELTDLNEAVENLWVAYVDSERKESLASYNEWICEVEVFYGIADTIVEMIKDLD